MSEPAVVNPFQRPTPPIPRFEGRTVDAASIRIVGTMPTDELPPITVSVDDTVRLVGEYRVVGVRHYVDPKTGDLIREQVLKPLVLDTMPWDTSDPSDDGIIRAPKVEM
jgi:hypothetical protein